MHWRIRLLISTCIDWPPRDEAGWEAVEAGYKWILQDIANNHDQQTVR